MRHLLGTYSCIGQLFSFLGNLFYTQSGLKLFYPFMYVDVFTPEAESKEKHGAGDDYNLTLCRLPSRL
jgi:hypothetical protein